MTKKTTTEVRQALFEAAHLEDVIVADCDHKYLWCQSHGTQLRIEVEWDTSHEFRPGSFDSEYRESCRTIRITGCQWPHEGNWHYYRTETPKSLFVFAPEEKVKPGVQVHFKDVPNTIGYKKLVKEIRQMLITGIRLFGENIS